MKAGDEVVVNNRLYRAVPNLIQIMKQEGTCDQCAFAINNRPGHLCGNIKCGSPEDPVENQVIFQLVGNV